MLDGTLEELPVVITSIVTPPKDQGFPWGSQLVLSLIFLTKKKHKSPPENFPSISTVAHAKGNNLSLFPLITTTTPIIPFYRY